MWDPAAGQARRVEAWHLVEDLSLDAQLVTLAACSTGSGAALEGEGPQGLMRTFRLLGADSVVATLWPIRDSATAELMVEFYSRLRRGADPARALAAAQRRFANREVTSLPSGGDLQRERDPTRAVGGLAPSSDADHRLRSHPYFWAAFQIYR